LVSLSELGGPNNNKFGEDTGNISRLPKYDLVFRYVVPVRN